MQHHKREERQAIQLLIFKINHHNHMRYDSRSSQHNIESYLQNKTRRHCNPYNVFSSNQIKD